MVCVSAFRILSGCAFNWCTFGKFKDEVWSCLLVGCLKWMDDEFRQDLIQQVLELNRIFPLRRSGGKVHATAPQWTCALFIQRISTAPQWMSSCLHCAAVDQFYTSMIGQWIRTAPQWESHFPTAPQWKRGCRRLLRFPCCILGLLYIENRLLLVPSSRFIFLGAALQRDCFQLSREDFFFWSIGDSRAPT